MHAFSRAFAASAFTLLLVPGIAAAEGGGPYASIFGGINFLHDNDFQIGSSDPSLTGFSVIPAKMFFDPGGIVGAAVGYDWGSFAAEAELSGRRGIFDHEEIFVGSIPLDGHYDAISVMANAYYRFHNDTHFIPYVGAGAGVAFLSAKVTPSGAPPPRHQRDPRSGPGHRRHRHPFGRAGRAWDRVSLFHDRPPLLYDRPRRRAGYSQYRLQFQQRACPAELEVQLNSAADVGEAVA